MDKNIGIYKIENIINGKKYIGSSINIDKRFYRHKNDLINNKHNNIHLQRDFNKYSLYDFKFECIEICDVNNIKKIEQKYLDKIFEIKNNNNIYYNIGKQSSGGDNISQHPDNKLIKEKISNGLYNRYNNESEEDKKRRRKNLLGEKNPNYGNIWDNEQRSKMSNQRKGLPSKNKGKNFEDIYGKEKSCKLKKILSENMKKRTGEKNPNYGNTCSDELKEYYSKKFKGKRNKNIINNFKPFVIDNKNYILLKDAEKDLNINYLTIRYRLLTNNEKFSNYYYIINQNLKSKLLKEYKNKYFN